MKSNPLKSPFECVDPSVGDWLWRLERPDLDPSMRALLEAHVSVCDACREVVRLDARMRTLVREGRLRAPTLRPRGGPRRELRVAALALAASLVALVALPPRPVTDAGAARGATGPRFTRPAEGEVVATDRPVFRWTPVEGVTRYEVSVRDRDGRVVWSGESHVPEIRVDEGVDLEPGEYRAILSVRPADLAPPAPASVAFRSGSLGGALLHRARWGPPWLQVGTLLSLGLLSLAWLGRRASRDGEGG